MENTWGIVQSVDPLEVRFAGDSTDTPVAVAAVRPWVGQKVMLAKLGALDGWVVSGSLSDTSWTAVTFEGTWVNGGGVRQTMQYRRVGDRVEFRGQIKSGSSGTVAFTLPEGFRPPAEIPLTISSFSAGPVEGALVVEVDGSVLVYVTTTSNVFVDASFSVSE